MTAGRNWGVPGVPTWQLLHLSLEPSAATNFLTITRLIHSLAFTRSRGWPRILATGCPLSSVWHELHLIDEPSALLIDCMRWTLIQLATSLLCVVFGKSRSFCPST